MPMFFPAVVLRNARIFLCLVVSVFLASCESSTTPDPPLPQPDSGWIDIRITPEWVQAPWTMTRTGQSYEGVGDSILNLETSGQYNFYGGSVENLIRNPFPTPMTGELVFGDTLSFHLSYAQKSWGHLYPEIGFGSWTDLHILENGGAIVCGVQDNHPRVAIMDRNGELLMNETQAMIGSFDKIVPLSSGDLLFCGQSDEGVFLSARNLAGQELWSHSPGLVENSEFCDLVPNLNGGFFLLTVNCTATPACTPTVSILDGNGVLISENVFEGPLNQLGLSISPRPSGGCYFLRARLSEEKTSNFINEMLLLDENCAVEQVIKFGTDHSGLEGSSLVCANGDVIFTFENHLGDITTDVVRLSDSGQVIWQINFANDHIHVLNVFEESPEGNFLLGGFSFSTSPATTYMTWLVELSPSGEVIHNRQSNMGSTYININRARMGWDGGVFVAGQYGHYTSGSSDPWVNRTEDYWFFEPLPD